jgi:hypothetical protein
MKTKSVILKNQSGQGVVEAVLLIATLLFVSTFVAREFKSNELVSKIVKGPWLALSGMISSGTWKPPAEAAALHPLASPRPASLEGTRP